ncbi:MAG: hypothetical protein V1729_00815 [Candidatus Woesearchaeota archaeon]
MTNRHKGCNNPKKWVEPTTEGKCKYCNKTVKSLETHIHDKHKGKKGAFQKIKELIFSSKRTKEE